MESGFIVSGFAALFAVKLSFTDLFNIHNAEAVPPAAEPRTSF